MAQCDKLSRHPSDERDPCSECRHFGGDKVHCKLATNGSYNDAVYRQMLVRCGPHEYKLAPFMSARKKGPMPAERVKSDWQGQSPDVLMAKSDLLPPGVRDCPRAFIVPARESGGRAKSRAFHANEAQRLSQSSSQPPQPWQGYSHSPFMPPLGPSQPAVYTLPLSPPPPPPPPAVVPARHPVTGHVAPAF
jgi:hypothetical protein